METDQTFAQTPVPRPKNWLVESILVTIFCCLPFGIVGIIFSSQVNSKYDAGDIAGALKSSKDAGTWTKVGFFTGLGIIILYVIFVFIVGVSFLGASHHVQ
ncbi:hypothetical protein BEL04_18675 [Mucilaginibacter sp. PPCGB 2223]|uniref:CD225/dispanin family protein n=1 Tax=Mucilaginibacter sp. PPCGB 2223 TaxID=1886027 RepID=UPI000826CCCF|nr:CD225/dispanin family protein [Mucilaginibacter sp. PPCGB 2223]OCX50759.1 hypothetical protein BEL04_18675 [Mucilaginibacter sp. PPCGB 2223]